MGSQVIVQVSLGVKGDQGEQGLPGTPGNPGAPGVGVPPAGTTGQVLTKASDTDYDTEWADPSGTVDNAAVNSAIATNPVATRAALEVVDDPRLYNPGPITRWVAAGDSITGFTLGATMSHPTWPWMSNIASGKSVPFTRNGTNIGFAESGNKLSNFISNWMPQILALNPKPSHCFMQYGTNDTPDGLTRFIGSYTSIIASLRAGGVEPIILSTPPAAPYYRGTDYNNATRHQRVAQFNEALFELCRQYGVRFIDNRFLEIPGAPGTAYRGTFNEGDIFGLHPAPKWHFAVGCNVAKTINEFGVGEDVYGAGYATLNEHPNFSSLPTQTAGANITLTPSLIAREDGVGGNLLQVIADDGGVKQMGSGDTGVLFTPKPGVDSGEFDVTVHLQSYYYGVGGTSGTPTTIPAVAISQLMGTTRKMLIIKPARPVNTNTSLITQVIDAVNNHPEASKLCTASSTGTPGTNVFNPPVSSTSTGSTWIEPTPTSDKSVTSTDLVRAVCEIWMPDGANFPGIYLYGRDAGGGGYSVIASIDNQSDARPQPVPNTRVVMATEWVAAGSKRRFQIMMKYGGGTGTYYFGRPRVQKRNA